jgi:hypothetical protein
VDLAQYPTACSAPRVVQQSVAVALFDHLGVLPWARFASVFKMMEVSRHRSVDTLSGYVRRVDLFREHAGRTFL